MTESLEWAAFRLKPGVGDADLAAASTALQTEFLARTPGFLRRDLVRAADGTYVDAIWWESHAAAQAAMAAADSDPACAAYFGLMDMASMTPPTHYALVARS